MKKKFMGIALVLVSVLFVGNVYAEAHTTECGTTENEAEVKCTLTDNVTMTVDNNKIDKPVTINAGGKTITVSNNLEIEQGGSLTIINGTLSLTNSAKLTVKGDLTIKDADENSKLSDETLITAINQASGTAIEVDGGSLTISNVGRGLIGANLTLNNGATFTATNNKENVMNGGTLTAKNDSKIIVKDNDKGGVNGVIILRKSSITATHNGFSGVTFNTNSNIGATATVTATGNNWNTSAYTPDDRTPAKADVLFNGTVKISGTLTADSIAPLKITYKPNAADNKVQTTNVTVDGTVTVNEIKNVCDGDAITCYNAKTVTIADESKGLLIENDVATIFGSKVVTEGYKFGSNIKKVIVSDKNHSELKFEVEGGSTVINNSQNEITVTGNGTTVVIPVAKEGEEATPVVVGTAPVAPSTETTNPSEKDDAPETNDIFPMALVGIMTLGLAGTYTYRKLHA